MKAIQTNDKYFRRGGTYVHIDENGSITEVSGDGIRVYRPKEPQKEYGEPISAEQFNAIYRNKLSDIE